MKLTYTRPKPLLFLRENLRSAYAPRSVWAKHLPLWRRGFSSEQISLYELDSKPTHDYFPDFLKYRFTVRTNQGVWPILHDKLLFDSFMGSRLPISRLLGVSNRGEVMPIQEGWTIADAVAGLQRGMEYVVKPLRGGGGGGLHFVSLEADSRVRINTGTITLPEFPAWFAAQPHAGIYERIGQHRVLAALYPRTTNTLRVAMFRRKNLAPELLAAFLRVGVKRSEPVDNTNLGGITVRVSDAGLTDAAYTRDARGVGTSITHHPDTGASLLGLEIPYWSQVIELLTSFHDQHPLFDYVGWDVAITPEGPLVFEGNHNPSLRGLQFYEPLKARPSFREFCEERGIL